jgi:hypothetical protein
MEFPREFPQDPRTPLPAHLYSCQASDRQQSESRQPVVPVVPVTKTAWCAFKNVGGEDHIKGAVGLYGRC